MVSYQAWVSIVFDSLQDRGVQVDDLDDGASVMEFAGETWQQHGRRLGRMNQSEAEQAALKLAHRGY
jgi:hypothetical protein